MAVNRDSVDDVQSDAIAACAAAVWPARHAASVRSLAAVILAAACLHEFVWMVFEPEIQGDVRYVTQWLLTATLCMSLWLTTQNKIIAAACCATVIMSSTTALCSAWWLITRFETFAGEVNCSRQLGVPIQMLSVIAAAIVLRRWGTSNEQ